MKPPRAPKSRLRLYGEVILFWNPLMTLAVLLVLGGKVHLGVKYLISLAIATIVATSGFALVAAVALVEDVVARKRGAPPATHGHSFWFMLSVVAMPPGMFIAFAALRFGLGLIGVSFHPPSFAEYRFGFFLGALISGLFFLWHTRKEAELRYKEAENQRFQAQLAALAAQLNPHLLFNALNTVASLIRTDPARAEQTIVRLSELYRGVLRSTDRAVHRLADELALCRAYLEVEQARFGDRLRSSIEISGDLDPEAIELPVLLVQPLVENAVRHGLASRAEGGTVRIRAAAHAGELELVVEDDGVGLGRSPRAGSGIGLRACHERLRLQHGDRASLDVTRLPEGGTRALVRLPLPAARAARAA
jgi:two-component sensor histidine kinase